MCSARCLDLTGHGIVNFSRNSVLKANVYFLDLPNRALSFYYPKKGSSIPAIGVS